MSNQSPLNANQKIKVENKAKEPHYLHRLSWVRAAVLGANDGIISTSSIVVGVAAANPTREAIVLAAIASVVAGALSMAAGEYVSVSSQSDIESADLEREQLEINKDPEGELQELTEIFLERGLNEKTAREVARQMSEHDALGAHAREELGITELSKARPMQAAIASAAAFLSGGALPLLVSMFAPVSNMVVIQYVATVFALGLLGVVAAKTGGSNVKTGVLRITFWGSVAMGVTALVGYLFGVSVA